MELNGFVIESRRMLRENFLPFQRIWDHVENGLYQECIVTFQKEDKLASEILDVSEWLLHGKTERPPERKCLKEYQNFAQSNQEQIKALEEAAKNGKQKNILYLCVLMHMHAGHDTIEPETGEFIYQLLQDRETVMEEADASGEPGMHRQRFGIVGKEACYLDGNGRIVLQRDGRLLPMAKDMRGLRSFAYTDMLGLIAIDGNGQVEAREGLTFLDVPSGVKMVSVSAYLSSYMLLDENGAVYTNMDMDLTDWTDLRYIYTGLNSAVGIKRWSGDVVTVGVGKVPALTNVVRMHTYHHRGERHYIALLANGEMRSDSWDAKEDKNNKAVTAVTLGADGYYYAREDGKVYRRGYDEDQAKEEVLCMKAKGRVKELLVERGKIFALS